MSKEAGCQSYSRNPEHSLETQNQERLPLQQKPCSSLGTSSCSPAPPAPLLTFTHQEMINASCLKVPSAEICHTPGGTDTCVCQARFRLSLSAVLTVSPEMPLQLPPWISRITVVRKGLPGDSAVKNLPAVQEPQEA